MSERYDLPRIPSTTAPTLLNREAGSWGFLGGLIGSVAGKILAGMILGTAGAAASPLLLWSGAAVALGGPILGTALGVAHGGAKGQARQLDELQHGRVVKDPSYLNSGIWSGLLVANMVGLVVAATALLGVGLAPVIAFGLGILPLAAAITGSVIRKGSMQQDYNVAVIQQQHEHFFEQGARRREALEQATGRAPTIYKDSVTAQETALLESKQAAASKTSFAETLQQTALQTAAAR